MWLEIYIQLLFLLIISLIAFFCKVLLFPKNETTEYEEFLETLRLITEENRNYGCRTWSEKCFQLGCKYGDLEIVKYFLDLRGYRRIDVHAKNDLAFRLACQNNHFHICKLLLSLKDDRKINLNKFDFSNFSLFTLLNIFPDKKEKNIYKYRKLSEKDNCGILHHNEFNEYMICSVNPHHIYSLVAILQSYNHGLLNDIKLNNIVCFLCGKENKLKPKIYFK